MAKFIVCELSLAFLIALPAGSDSIPAKKFPHIFMVPDAEASVRHCGVWGPARNRQVLHIGDAIQVSNGHLEVVFGNGIRVHVEPGSLVVLREYDTHTAQTTDATARESL